MIIAKIIPFNTPIINSLPTTLLKLLVDNSFFAMIGKDLNLEKGYQAAERCGLSIVAHVKNVCGGNLDKVKSCVKLTGYVNSTDDFKDQPKIINGASDIIAKIFNDLSQRWTGLLKLMDINLIIVAVYSYLLGSIPFGLILTKIFLKKDIREIGSGNIGATNALRTGNKLIGYSTLILDVLKAVTSIF